MIERAKSTLTGLILGISCSLVGFLVGRML